MRFAVQPPIPSSVLSMYMFFIVVALLLFVSSDDDRFAEFKRPVIALLTLPERALPRRVLGVLLPLLAAYLGYAGAQTEAVPPALQRTVHPAPPSEIDFKGKQINLLTAENPFRHLEEEDSAAFHEHVAKGKEVYYRNCVFCHGDNLEGDGLYAHGLSPIPANLADPGTIAQLQESYLFWRITKGGPGLPVGGAPWDSAMPAWEKFLDEGEVWDVILFLYDFTGARPRSWGEEH
jgi:mono/diheme cytochrome c family protein